MPKRFSRFCVTELIKWTASLEQGRAVYVHAYMISECRGVTPHHSYSYVLYLEYIMLYAPSNTLNFMGGFEAVHRLSWRVFEHFIFSRILHHLLGKSRVSHMLEMYPCWCAGCGVHAYQTPDTWKLLVCFPVIISLCFHPSLVQQVKMVVIKSWKHACAKWSSQKSALCFSTVSSWIELVHPRMTPPPPILDAASKPNSCHVVLSGPSSLSWMPCPWLSMPFSFLWTI